MPDTVGDRDCYGDRNGNCDGDRNGNCDADGYRYTYCDGDTCRRCQAEDFTPQLEVQIGHDRHDQQNQDGEDPEQELEEVWNFRVDHQRIDRRAIRSYQWMRYHIGARREL